MRSFLKVILRCLTLIHEFHVIPHGLYFTIHEIIIFFVLILIALFFENRVKFLVSITQAF